MEQVDPERLARFREAQNRRVAGLRQDLDLWIERHTGPISPCDDPAEAQFRGPYTEITVALVEAALDRLIALHGGEDARALLLSHLERRLTAYKRALQ